jgi:4-aminobutyrate aminotransferase/(S)-3-amino-2-methylpropionate transaminase
MIGIELVKDRNSKAPANKLVDKLVEHAYRSGLLVRGYGRYGNRNVIRLTPHLVTTDEQVEIALDILEDSFKSLN